MKADKEATFWHFISEGQTEEERVSDLRRCERVRWPKPVIENSTDSKIKYWKNTRKGEPRICLWLECEDYVVLERKRLILDPGLTPLGVQALFSNSG
jgi:hypothetical protein